MGLDMYLSGRKYLRYGNDQMEDGFRVEEKIVRLGYWRKHPDLHGYIVKTFAEGVDECQRIDLDLPALESIVKAVAEHRLPGTTGFFFGSSETDDDQDTTAQLKKAIDWLKQSDDGCYRSVEYRASW